MSSDSSANVWKMDRIGYLGSGWPGRIRLVPVTSIHHEAVLGFYREWNRIGKPEPIKIKLG